MPECAAYLWRWFLRMSRRRSSGGFGLSPLTHPGIAAFFELSGIQPTPWEVEQIEKLDDLWLSIRAAKDDDKGKQHGKH
ncbi:hypothetical protein [uncultured Desulfuromonas sp.]|uniref:phage tail assembly chaperone n=1 Tax=uncultured Desulfuromonas sp. TaxID=181013 RepID=UPI002AAAC179|nr:hypothetical protein [uncultured Desulfuromonas sp.]